MVSGLAVGMTCNSVPLFIAQSSASQEKGSNGSMHQIGISVGIFLAMVQGIVNDAYFSFGWQVLTAGIPLAVSGAAIGFATRLPSDVAWLLACDKEAEAAEVAARLYGREADVRLDRFRALQGNSHVSKRFTGVLESQYRWCVLSGAAVAIVQQVSGVNVVCSTFGYQLRKLGLGSNTVALFTVLLNLSNILTTVCMAPHYNSSNISTLMRSGLLAMALCLLVPCLGHSLAQSQMTSVFVAFGCVLFVSVFSATLGPLTWIYLAELFPSEVRNTALSVCGALNLSASFLTVFVAGFFPVIDTLYVFGSVSLAGWAFVRVALSKSCVKPSAPELYDRLLTPPTTGLACQGLLCSAACAVRPGSAFASVLFDKLAEFEDGDECAVAVSGINHLDQAASIKRLLRTALASVLEPQNIKVVNPSLLQVELQVDMLQTPPSLTPVVSRLSIFVRGRYNKLSRCVTQTDWTVDGVPKTTHSVGSIVGGPLVSLFGAEDYNFCAAGREDLDVRMLGSGRPFLVELFNSKRVTLPDETEMTHAINLVSPQDVQVHTLELLNGPECIRSKSLFTEMQSQAEQKRKTYGCVCRASQRVTDVAETLTALVGEISQKTPVRVAHRRAMLTRVKHIYSLKVHVVDDQYFCMLVEAEAGTYIKELVHGDHGRTVPSVHSLLRTPVDLVQLDVLDLDFDTTIDVSSPVEIT